MKNKKLLRCMLSIAAIVFGISVFQTFAQPSEAKIKKDVMGPKTVSLTLGGPGTIEWSSTYKKYVWSRNFTAKVKTDTPGEFLIVKGYASYDIMGGRYVYWRTFTSSNSYAGKKNPSISEINQAIATAEVQEFDRIRDVIGEYESLKIAADPNWEWHTANSVSFNVVAVYRVINRGKHYGDEAQHQRAQGYITVDKIESLMRLRIYRNDEKSPWSSVINRSVLINARMPGANGAMVYTTKLLDRKDYPAADVQKMARMSKVPLLTQ